MDKSAVGILIGAFVAILIGVIGVAIVADSTISKTQLTTTIEQLSLTPAIINATWYNETPISLGTHSVQSGFRTDYSECEITSLISVTNYSGTAKTTPAKYNFTAASSSTPAYITLAGGDVIDTAKDWISATSNTTFVTYRYCADDYIGGWAKTVTNLVPGFFAIAIMIAAAFIIFWILKKENVDLGI
jgi:hypothetical protein